MTLYEKEFKEIGYTGEFFHDMQLDTKLAMQNKMGSRSGLIKKYGFAVLTQEAITELKKYSPFIEVGAGYGYWAYEFKKSGIECIATDNYSYEENYLKESKYHTEVIMQDGVKAVQDTAYAACYTLLMCWPSYEVPWSGEVLKAFSGEFFIYVGEDCDGCTGDEEFHKMLDKEWELIQSISIPQFPGIHDTIKCYKRND